MFVEVTGEKLVGAFVPPPPPPPFPPPILNRVKANVVKSSQCFLKWPTRLYTESKMVQDFIF